jgi:hypothetical protein
MLRDAAAFVGAMFVAGCSIVGVRSGTEQPQYTLIDRISPDIEIRHYAPRLAAETWVRQDRRGDEEARAFSRLAGYIFGENQNRDSVAMTAPVEAMRRSAQIAMTSPVEATASSNMYRMRFFLPRRFTAANAPLPNDRAISLVELGPEMMAALRFSGSRSPHAVAQRAEQLIGAVRRSGWQPVGDYVAYFYDPPWTLPPLRRNEVVVAISRVQ